MNRGRTRLNKDGLKELRSRLDSTIKVALVQTAIIIRDEMQVRAPKDTEAMAKSIHVATSEKSDYVESVEEAKKAYEAAKSTGRTPKGIHIAKNSRLELYPEVRPEKENEVWVVCGVTYGLINEYGSVTRGPQPFMTPAVRNHVGTLTEQIRTAMSGLSVKGVFSTYSKRG